MVGVVVGDVTVDVFGVPATVVLVAVGAWPPASTCTSAVMVDAGGLGRGVLSGPNPAVISCRLRNLRLAGFSVVTPPVSTSSLFFVFVEITQARAWTTPTLPASGVPDGHLSPFLYSGAEVVVDGYLRAVLVSVSPV